MKKLHENEVKYSNTIDTMEREHKETEMLRAQTITDEIQRGMEELEKKYLKAIEEMEVSHQQQLDDTQKYVLKEQQDVLMHHITSFEEVLNQKEMHYKQIISEKEAEYYDKQKELEQSTEIISSFISKEEELRLTVASVEEKYGLLLGKKDEQLRLMGVEVSRLQSDCQSIATSNEREYVDAITSMKEQHAAEIEQNMHKYHNDMQILTAELNLMKEKYNHSDIMVRSISEEIKALDIGHSEEKESLLTFIEGAAEEKKVLLEKIAQLSSTLDKVTQEKTVTMQQLMTEQDIKVDQFTKTIELLEAKIINKNNEIELLQSTHKEELSHVLTRQQQALLDKHRDEIDKLRKLNQDIDLRHQEVTPILLIHLINYHSLTHSTGVDRCTRNICK